MILALRNGLLEAAVCAGHTERVIAFLKNPSLRAADIHKAIQKAYTVNNAEIARLLLADSRLIKEPYQLRNVRKHAIGNASPELARVLLASPNVRFKHLKNNILYAALSPFGAELGNWYSRCNLGTLQLLLADPRFTLDQEFCRDLCVAVTHILDEGQWEEYGEPVGIPWFHGGNFVSYTNFEKLERILRADERFAPFIYR